VAGKDYSQGYKTYGFAAPFMSEKQVEQDKGRVQAVHYGGRLPINSY
jgi:hypothetical protein